MTIEYAANPAAVSALFSHYWIYSRRLRVRMVLNAPLLILFPVIISISLAGSVDAQSIALALVTAFSVLFLIAFVARVRTKEDKRTLSIDPSGIHTRIGAKNGDVPWSMILDVFAREENLLIVGRNLDCFCIPRNAFGSASEAEEFTRSCQAYLSMARVPLSRKIRTFLTPWKMTSLVLLVLICIYGHAIVVLIYARWEAQRYPQIWTVPISLSLAPASSLPGRKFFYFGYEFDSPWTDLKDESETESRVILHFSNGASIGIFEHARIEDDLETIERDVPATKHVADWLGADTNLSKYELRRKIYHLTPQGAHLSLSRLDMIENSTLLIIKLILMKTTRGDLYSFETPWVRGFQEGHLDQDERVTVQVFDIKDHEVEFYIRKEKDVDGQASQNDVNRILSSLRPNSR